jgi:hypothetical protein
VIKETKVNYLALPETKKKGQGVEELNEDFLLFYEYQRMNEQEPELDVYCKKKIRKD